MSQGNTGSEALVGEFCGGCQHLLVHYQQHCFGAHGHLYYDTIPVMAIQ